MNVLSLFDGISCGRVALERVGIKIDKYYSSEVNQDSILVANKNYPQDKENRLGDVTKWQEWEIDWSSIDLLIGGSPCQGLSRAKTNRENLEDFRSILFYTYVDILNHIKTVNPDIKFLLENVKPNKETLSIMNEVIGIEPFIINSNLVSAQNRIRCYWFNWDTIQPKDKGLVINDIVYNDSYKVFYEDERISKTKIKTKNYLKWDKSGKGYWSQQDRAYYKNGKMCTVPKAHPSDKLNIIISDGVYRRCHPIEAERLQTLPDNYTSCIKSNSKRIGLVGDGWTVDVIAHILKGLIDIF